MPSTTGTEKPQAVVRPRGLRWTPLAVVPVGVACMVSIGWMSLDGRHGPWWPAWFIIFPAFLLILYRALRQARMRVEVWPDRLRVVNVRGKERWVARSEVARYVIGPNRTWWWGQQGYAVLSSGEQVPLDGVQGQGRPRTVGSDRAEEALAFLRGQTDSLPGPRQTLRLWQRLLLALCSVGAGLGVLWVIGGVEVYLRQPDGVDPGDVASYVSCWLVLAASAFGMWYLIRKSKRARDAASNSAPAPSPRPSG